MACLVLPSLQRGAIVYVSGNSDEDNKKGKGYFAVSCLRGQLSWSGKHSWICHWTPSLEALPACVAEFLVFFSSALIPMFVLFGLISEFGLIYLGTLSGRDLAIPIGRNHTQSASPHFQPFHLPDACQQAEIVA
eukprot:1147733-Pelagomonas_calceolata.AAC.1